MKVMRLADAAGTPALVEDEIPQPEPGPGEVLVRVYAAGVTPTEVLWYPTSHTKAGGPRTGAVPGHEFSGVVETANTASGFAAGQEVYGMNDWFSEGAMAEYCLTKPEFIAPKPARLTHADAASVPIGALTAWQGLFDHARIQPGERLLVHGGSGGVGAFAVQLGRYRGARVFATASARNLDFVRELGAEQVIDYHARRFEDSFREMDVVFDTAGGETLQRSWRVLKPQGRMVTIAAAGEDATDDRVKNAFFIVQPNQKQLIEIGSLLDAGKLRALVAAVVPLTQASAVFGSGVQERKGRGKLVVAVAARAVAGRSASHS
jgi:NADPH:quinone reductase-like Zn-dependent oxidoreductase